MFFQVETRDTVAIALCDVKQGVVRLRGEAGLQEILAIDDIDRGHKIAVKAIKSGEPILKYGVVIGEAIADIEVGQWVHLHNMKSLFDEKSSALDLKTGTRALTY
jgi:predicted RecA/RadA family phage recombinase